MLVKAIAIDPSRADAYKNFGYVLAEMGHYEEARTAYLQALKINPNDQHTQVNFRDAQAHLR